MREARISVTFLLLAVTFCVCLIVSNLMEIKTVALGPLTITAGVVVFPLSYILNDCIVEVYGFAKARLVIWLGFGMNLLVTLLLQLGLLLPGDASWHGQDAMQMVFGAVPRIFLASFVAFLCGSMVNAYVMARMKLTAQAQGAAAAAGGAGASPQSGFSLRAIVSSLWGEGVDSLVFFPIAFGGVLPWNQVGVLIVTQALLKTLYEVAILPITLRAVKWLRSWEGEQPAQRPASYKWWRIGEL